MPDPHIEPDPIEQFDMGPFRDPEVSNAAFGNIDNDFDDFSAEGEGRGKSNFPLKVIYAKNRSGYYDVSVVPSKLYDFSVDPSIPSEFDLELGSELKVTSSGTYYFLLVLTLDLSAGKKVTSVYFLVRDEDNLTPDNTNEVFLKVAKFVVDIDNGNLVLNSGSSVQYLAGVVVWPASPNWATFDVEAQILKLGRNPNDSASPSSSSNLQDFLLWISGETDPLTVKEVTDENEEDTFKVLATRDFTIPKREIPSEIPWASYNEETNVLEFGGVNTDGVSDLKIDVGAGAVDIFGSIASQGIKADPSGLENTPEIELYFPSGKLRIGESFSDNGVGFEARRNNKVAVLSSGSLMMEDFSNAKHVEMDVDHLPATATGADPAKFRPLLVCDSDEVKEIYVLSTKPEAPAT